MPEIGEIARAVHFLKKNLVGRTISNVLAPEDDLLFGKVGTNASAFSTALTGKKVLDAQQQGKYFWLVLSSPPHPLIHFGMTGWIDYNNEETWYYRKPDADGVVKAWPPRFWKFVIETADGGPKAALTDPRRLARARLIDCVGSKIRTLPPLSANGPDPVRDKALITPEWIKTQLGERRVPIKAWLLDQANISGVGNWVADEVLYGARIHPAAPCASLSDAQLEALREQLLGVTGKAVEVLSDSEKFPEHWIMRHRWGKGKHGNKLPSGESLSFVTVGGRTSAVVTARQKMGQKGKETGVKAEAAEDEDEQDPEEKPSTPVKKRKTPKVVKSVRKTVVKTSPTKKKVVEVEEKVEVAQTGRRSSRRKPTEEVGETEVEVKKGTKRKSTTSTTKAKAAIVADNDVKEPERKKTRARRSSQK
ncbi:MAG: hypothetical protein M1814_003017 [Vezdaea aestivalis]|nr:MAG: hypothetical protein M1814_003017 [Vezdaea aestivalis]